MTFNLKDNNGRTQRIHARTLEQAQYELMAINAENQRQRDRARALPGWDMKARARVCA